MPRPILKRNSPPPPALGLDAVPALLPFADASLRHVNFPDSSELCITHDVHSPGTYDRSPIVVNRNSCALPERGCPGRTYAPSSAGKSPVTVISDRQLLASSAHAPQRHPHHQMPCPDLCFSSSSESDESSDGFASPPSEPWLPTPSSSPTCYFSPSHPESSPSTPTQELRSLSFLPHPNPHSPVQQDGIERPRPATPLKRRPKSVDEETIAAGLAPTTATVNKPPKKKKSHSPSHTPRIVKSLSFSSTDDDGDGCLGGF